MSFDDLPDPVFLVDEDDCGLISPGFFLLEFRVGNNYHLVTHSTEAGGGAVKANYTGISLPRYNVSFEAFAVVYVYNLHLLVWKYAGSLEKFRIHREAPFIVELGFSNAGPVNLRFAKC